MVARFEDFYDTCPKCGANMMGDPIPEEDRRFFGDTHFKRWIGVEEEADRRVRGAFQRGRVAAGAD